MQGVAREDEVGCRARVLVAQEATLDNLDVSYPALLDAASDLTKHRARDIDRNHPAAIRSDGESEGPHATAHVNYGGPRAEPAPAQRLYVLCRVKARLAGIVGYISRVHVLPSGVLDLVNRP